MSKPSKPAAILFDLDGTLIDSAPDLAQAADVMRTSRGLPSIAYDQYRPMAGAGARGMLGVAFGEFGLKVTADNKNPICPYGDFNSLKEEFFKNYESHLTARTSVFAGVMQMLQSLTTHNIAWGVVTNKSKRFTTPLVWELIAKRLLPANPVAVISGDTTPFAKPHPEPLLEACRVAGVKPEQCWYVGDDKRDIDAGRAALMFTIAAHWGYEGEHSISTWGADLVLDTPLAVLDLV